ncbi:MAG TPA: GPR endopeptidase [Candidatus Fimenecus excrementavium]|nr:GPR endopeptidase [Candidatus Fimenecus excrementavium]
MDFRTDLAVEQREMTAKHSDNVAVRQYARQNANVTEIEILNDEGAQELGKPKGKYITMEIPAFSHDSELLDGRLTAMTESIRTLLPDEDGPVLVAGLGNEDVTPDALGPRTAHGIFATRHIDRALASELGFGELRDVCAITFGVLGQTGMETAETIRGIVNTIHPAAVITVDALAARSLQRLGKTVQLTDTGITPGSGVGNSRARLDKETLGVPVIAIGVPTVVDAVTLVRDFTSEHKMAKEKEDEAKAMMVCPREIDVTIRRAARFLALSLNCALQPSISPDILLTIV